VDRFDNAKAVLEFDAALAWLSEEAQSESGRLAALALTPDLEPGAVLESWALIAEGREILSQGAAPDLSGHLDLDPVLAPLKVEGAGLDPEELLAVAQEAACIQRARTALAPLTDLAPRLAALAAGLTPCPELLAAIERTVGPEGEILDTASPELARLRLSAAATRRGLTLRLSSLIHSEAFRPLVQDEVITTRSDRFVIPVRASAAGQNRGLVHDWSKTGATAFLEPLEVVEDNNKLGFLKRQEKAEIDRLLRRLSRDCREAAPDLTASGLLLTRLDLIMAQARLARAWSAAVPEYRAGGGVNLRAARHPLLMRREKGMTPLELVVEPEKPVVIVSGLNTGGKTVALKTLGLNLMLAKAGLHLPVGEGSRLDLPERLLAVLGDAQDLASDLSTFSGHVRALNLVLAEARPGLLVLLDEIGSGTDPAEGAALGLAVLESLRTSGALVWAATHYQLIKTWAALTPGVVSAAARATEAGQPLYGLAYGGPGFSGGLKMARRLGLPEDLVARAESYLDDGQRRAMELLARLDEERADLSRTREELAERNLALARAEAELRERTRGQAVEFQRRAETQNRAVTETLAAVRREFEELKAEMRAAAVFQARFSEKRAGLEGRLRSVRPRAEPGEDPLTGVRAGDRVRVGVLGRAAVVQAVNQERGEAWVEAGGLNVKVRLSELFPPETETRRPGSVRVTVTPAESAGLELHLLGRTVDEALGEVEKELDRAALAGRKTLYIVHGFGTGRLRQGIRRYLERHPRVKSFERAAQGAGGDGVTVVTLE